MVRNYFLVRPSVKATTEQVCNWVNDRYKKDLTTRDISRHISNLRDQNFLKNTDSYGKNAKGTLITRYAYIPSNKR